MNMVTSSHFVLQKKPMQFVPLNHTGMISDASPLPNIIKNGYTWLRLAWEMLYVDKI